jgi:hypothetical protein
MGEPLDRVDSYSPGDELYSEIILVDEERCIRSEIIADRDQRKWDCSAQTETGWRAHDLSWPFYRPREKTNA